MFLCFVIPSVSISFKIVSKSRDWCHWIRRGILGYSCVQKADVAFYGQQMIVGVLWPALWGNDGSEKTHPNKTSVQNSVYIHIEKQKPSEKTSGMVGDLGADPSKIRAYF